MLQPRTVLLDKYRIERVLGEGGMGVVALAHHLHLDQPVAIKFLRPDVLSKPTVVKRFLREAQAAVKLKNEHICKVLDVGMLDDGAPYMVMEFMDGMELGALAKDQGRLAAARIVELILQACEALAEAHVLGIVHRDIKPANLFITRRPDGTELLKVLDFGISKAPALLETDLTRTQTVLGTPAYMSPEQMRASKHVDARTDIWALGVVLYELLSGRRPFCSNTYSELCLQVGMDPTPAMDRTVPPGLAAVVTRCLEKDPAQRFANVAELAAALAPFAQDPGRAAQTVERIARVLSIGQIPVPGPAADQDARRASIEHASTEQMNEELPSTLSASTGQVADNGEPRRRWLIAGAAFAGLAALVLAMIVLASAPDTTVRDSHTIGSMDAGAAPDASRPVQASNAPDSGTTVVRPDTDTPSTDTTSTDIPNTDISNTDISNTDISNTDISNTDISNTDTPNTNAPRKAGTQHKQRTAASRRSKRRPPAGKARRKKPKPEPEPTSTAPASGLDMHDDVFEQRE